MTHNWTLARFSWTGVALLILLASYIFQQFNYLQFFRGVGGFLGEPHPHVQFIFNKSARFLINDAACFLLIFALFSNRNYLKIAFWLFLLELVVILPLYFVAKLYLEGSSEISSPLLSLWHRLVVNPLMMLLLIVAFWYQNVQKRG
jgi:exosortase F-associated protein